ncbi:hypothetical protein MIR68_000721 [Amoeboaphelidium protococcarum]|nr:hypothetical protein MIR68_000721 [Amoeboaphelidium protococcarum]
MSWQIAVGVSSSLLASTIDAVGLNLQRRDHIQNQSKPSHLQKPEYKRLQWVIGFAMYTGSQLFGSTAALYFLQPAIVASLSSAALVFNCILARYLVGTEITRPDLIGTLMILVGTVFISIFGSLKKEEFELDALLALYARPVFIIFFSVLFGFSVMLLAATILRHRKLIREKVEYSQKQVFRLVGIGYSISGGLIASITVQLAETGITMIIKTMEGSNQFHSASGYLIVLVLILSVTLQLTCMTLGLKVADSVLVVPLFFAFFDVFSLINQNIYYDLWADYKAINYGFMIPSIALLIYGVFILAQSSSIKDQLLFDLQNEETAALLGNSNDKLSLYTDYQRDDEEVSFDSRSSIGDESVVGSQMK